MLDPVANLVKISPIGSYGASDTSVTISSADASKLSVLSGAYNVTWWNTTDFPDPSDDPYAEIVRVTNLSGTTLTITRAAEGPNAASAKNLAGKTYKMILGITAEMIINIGNNLQQPWKLVNVDGTIDGVNTVFTLHGGIAPFDSNSVQITLGRQPQIQGIDYEISGTTITYVTPPPAALAGQPHIANYQ